MGGYDSFKYWNIRVNPNGYNDIKPYELKYMPNFLKGSKNLLDFGCGIGRTFDLYEGNVTGIDFSNKYEVRAREAAKNLEYNHIIHNVHTEPLPFKENHFNKGVAVKVLLHAPNDEAKTIINELGRVCEEVMIIAVNINTTTASHCFSRSYKEFIINLGFKVTSYNHEEQQDIITYTKLKHK